MKIATVLVALILIAPLCIADHRHVIADDKTDFSRIKTFTFLEGRATTMRPELNNRLIFKKVEEAIRTQLSAKGLNEKPDQPDIVIGFAIGSDKPLGPSVTFNQGMLTIEFTQRVEGKLIWQGVLTEDEGSTPAKVAERLPSSVKKRLAAYPPMKKK
jgi:hypothetical protein